MEFGRRRRSAVFDRDIPARTAVYLETLPLSMVGAAASYLNQIEIPIPIPAKLQRQRQRAANRILDAPGLLDDPHLNLLDWSAKDFVAIALGDAVGLWDAPSSISGEIVADETVTSVRWAPDVGSHIALGLSNSDIQLWDVIGNCKLRTLRGRLGRGRRCEADHSQRRVGSLDWNGNGNMLTSGGSDGSIRHSDVRLPSHSHVVHTYQGGPLRRHQICGLKWSDSGLQLASGGSDGLVHIWDSRNPDRWLFRFADTSATSTTVMRALAWCPFRDHLLATAGSRGGGEVKFWSTHTGTCINSLNTGSTGQVSALLWNHNKQELLTSCEGSNHQLTLWEYPSMLNIGQLAGHTNRVLYLAQSPDGCNIASASGGADETLRVWRNAFTSPMPEDDTSGKGGAFGDSHRTLIR